MATSSPHSSAPFPVPNPTVSYWLSKPSKLAHYKSNPSPPEHVDIAIIGGGLSGVCTAYHILKRHPTGAKPRVAIFEARTACSGATGRNGGHSKVSPVSVMSLQARWGDETAAALVRLAQEQRAALKAIVEREGLDCEFLLTRSLDVFFDAGHSAEVRDWLTAQWTSGTAVAEALREVQFLDGPNLERITGIKGVKGATSSPAASLWPYKFVMGLLARVLEMGGGFYAETPVRHVSYLHNSGEDATSLLHFSPTPTDYVATTRARHVVFATNGYTPALLPDFAQAIAPVRGTASHLVVPPWSKDPSSAPPFLSHTYNLHYTPDSVDYLVPQPDGAIVLGGGQKTYRDDLAKWWGNVDDAHLIEEVRPHFDGRMQAVFHGWQDSGSHLGTLWTGIQGYTADAMPHVGPVPGRKGQWIAAGFNGGGMAMIVTSTEALVRLILGEAKEWKDLGLPVTFEPKEARLRPERNVYV